MVIFTDALLVGTQVLAVFPLKEKRVYDGINGNHLSSETAADGTAIVRFEFLDVSVFAVDSDLVLILDAAVLGQIAVSFDGGVTVQPYDQTTPVVDLLRGNWIQIQTYFGSNLLASFSSPISNGVTKAFKAKNGDVIANPPDHGTAALISYDVLPLQIFAVDSSPVLAKIAGSFLPAAGCEHQRWCGPGL